MDIRVDYNVEAGVFRNKDRDFVQEVDDFIFGGFVDWIRRDETGCYVHIQDGWIPVVDWRKKYEFPGARNLTNLARYFFNLGQMEMQKESLHILGKCKDIDNSFTDSGKEGAMMDAVIALLENTSAIHPVFSSEKLIDWLKSLRPQPKQEWGEEDEIRRESCMLYLANARDGIEFSQHIGDNAKESGKKEIQKDIDWLKSLRPSWKPSEEQMEALNYAIAEWDGGKRLEGLYALRNDLKQI